MPSAKCQVPSPALPGFQAEGLVQASPGHSELCERRPGFKPRIQGSEPGAGGAMALTERRRKPCRRSPGNAWKRRFWIAFAPAMSSVRAFARRRDTQGVARQARCALGWLVPGPWPEEKLLSLPPWNGCLDILQKWNRLSPQDVLRAFVHSFVRAAVVMEQVTSRPCPAPALLPAGPSRRLTVGSRLSWMWNRGSSNKKARGGRGFQAAAKARFWAWARASPKPC